MLAQRLVVKDQKVISGVITEVRPGEITIASEKNDSQTFKIQDKGDRAISVEGRPARFPATINVRGKLPIKLIEPGMIVGFRTRCNVYGKSASPLESISVVSGDEADKLKVDFLERPEKNSDFADVDIVGRVNYLKGKRFQIQVPKAKWAKKEKMTFNVDAEATFSIRDDSLSRVKPGDKVASARVVQLTDEVWAVYEIEVELSSDREELSTEFDDKLENQFSNFSDDPMPPRQVRSEHFVLRTDLSDRSAQVLLAKLETMFDLVSNYFRARPNGPIQCVVIRDLRQWNLAELNPVGVAKIREPAGVTISRKLGNITQAVVYSCDNHGVVQHEAVHAFCYQTFGGTGPVWYSEGMAEMGNYWTPGNLEVDIDPVVINYLTRARPKKMSDIVAAGQITGDSWQAYAWRWALCHLLASNPNYADRFKTLGMNMMAKQEDSFELAFGKQREKISFEYDQFVKNFGNGYRVDLCTWDWKTKASRLTLGNRIKQKVQAKSGWQATKLKIEKGQSYDFIAQGEWSVNEVSQVDADGNDEGTGRLIGVIFSDYELSEPIELGTKGKFTADQDGQLYVRIRDEWTALSDNDGELMLHLRPTPKTDEGATSTKPNDD
ncbi:MAG: hypothetical protein AAFN77_06685 [Planctomycetota bacterium]